MGGFLTPNSKETGLNLFWIVINITYLLVEFFLIQWLNYVKTKIQDKMSPKFKLMSIFELLLLNK